MGSFKALPKEAPKKTTTPPAVRAQAEKETSHGFGQSPLALFSAWLKQSEPEWVSLDSKAPNTSTTNSADVPAELGKYINMLDEKAKRNNFPVGLNVDCAAIGGAVLRLCKLTAIFKFNKPLFLAFCSNCDANIFGLGNFSACMQCHSPIDGASIFYSKEVSRAMRDYLGTIALHSEVTWALVISRSKKS